MLINFVDATNDANHYTKPPPVKTFIGQKWIDLPISALVWES